MTKKKQKKKPIVNVLDIDEQEKIANEFQDALLKKDGKLADYQLFTYDTKAEENMEFAEFNQEITKYCQNSDLLELGLYNTDYITRHSMGLFMLNSQQQLLTRQEAAKYLVEKFMPILSLKLSSNRNFCKNIHTLPINEHPDFNRKIDDYRRRHNFKEYIKNNPLLLSVEIRHIDGQNQFSNADEKYTLLFRLYTITKLNLNFTGGISICEKDLQCIDAHFVFLNNGSVKNPVTGRLGDIAFNGALPEMRINQPLDFIKSKDNLIGKIDSLKPIQNYWLDYSNAIQNDPANFKDFINVKYQRHQNHLFERILGVHANSLIRYHDIFSNFKLTRNEFYQKHWTRLKKIAQNFDLSKFNMLELGQIQALPTKLTNEETNRVLTWYLKNRDNLDKTNGITLYFDIYFAYLKDKFNNPEFTSSNLISYMWFKRKLTRKKIQIDYTSYQKFLQEIQHMGKLLLKRHPEYNTPPDSVPMGSSKPFMYLYDFIRGTGQMIDERTSDYVTFMRDPNIFMPISNKELLNIGDEFNTCLIADNDHILKDYAYVTYKYHNNKYLFKLIGKEIEYDSADLGSELLSQFHVIKMWPKYDCKISKKLVNKIGQKSGTYLI